MFFHEINLWTWTEAVKKFQKVKPVKSQSHIFSLSNLGRGQAILLYSAHAHPTTTLLNTHNHKFLVEFYLFIQNYTLINSVTRGIRSRGKKQGLKMNETLGRPCQLPCKMLPGKYLLITVPSFARLLLLPLLMLLCWLDWPQCEHIMYCITVWASRQLKNKLCTCNSRQVIN